VKLQISENLLTDQSTTYDVLVTSDDGIRITIECLCEYDAEQLLNSMVTALNAAHIETEVLDRTQSGW
jgi:hypothetical protein